VAGKEELAAPRGRIYSVLEALQKKLSFLPDYNFRGREEPSGGAPDGGTHVKTGTTVSGIVGGAITIAVIALISIILRRKKSGIHDEH